MDGRESIPLDRAVVATRRGEPAGPSRGVTGASRAAWNDRIGFRADRTGGVDVARMRRVTMLVALPVVLATGCGSSVTGTAEVATGLTTTAATSSSASPTAAVTSSGPGSTTSTRPSGASGSSSVGAPSTQLTGTPVDREEFLARVTAANAAVTSVRGSMEVTGPSGLTASFDGTQSGGTLTAFGMDMTIEVQGKEVPLSLLFVDGKLYLASDVLLPSLGITTPWVLADPASSDPTIAQMGQEFAGITKDLGAGQVEQLRAALSEISQVGPAELQGPDGTVLPVTHYQGLVRGADLGLPGGADVVTDLFLDDKDRVVHTETTTEVAGQSVTSTVSIQAYDDPITITAPDPSEVSTR